MWLGTFRADSQRAWGQLDLFVPKNTPVGAANYATTLATVRNAMPNAPATAETLQPALTKNLLDSLIKDTQAKSLTWQDMKAIRTRIGEKLAEPQIVGDTSYTDLKRIYGALSDDLGAAVAARGPQAQAAFDRATALTRDGHGFIENVLSRVMKGDQIAPERAAANALSGAGGGGTMLGEIRREMPQAADELAAFKLRDMGLANAGVQNAEGARFSPGTFVTDKAKLSPEAFNALFLNDPRIGALATVGDSMKQTARFLNTSNTETMQAMRHALAGLSPVGALAGGAAGGWPGAAAGWAMGAALPWATGYGAARATTSPALTALMAAPAAGSLSPELLNRAALLPPALRALLGAGGGQP